jgi:5-methylthioribose kinase
MAWINGYAPLTLDAVGPFAAPYLDGEPVQVREISDGNLNLVFRVRSQKSSVIVKQAVPYLRVAGESWPLTRHRARIESEALAVHSKLAPGVLPALLHFDESMSALVLEDLVDHVTWREALMAEQPHPGVAEAVGEYTGVVILGTSDILLSSRQRKALRRDFVYSELSLVTEELVFTAPYRDAASNRYDEELVTLARGLRSDRALRAAAAKMRFAFKSRAEALIHGDLHTGSVMVKEGDTKVIDLEFAYFGPFGFDPGVLLGNLALSRIAHEEAGHHAYCTVVDASASAYWHSLTEQCRRLWDAREPWLAQFLDRLVDDAARFAGMEMIRRVVGLAHVKDIDVLEQPARFAAQTRAISGGRVLLLGEPVHSFNDLWHRAVGEEGFS